MNSGRFFMPPYMINGNNMMLNSMRSVSPIIRTTNSMPKGIGIFTKLTSGIRSVNWGGLLNNANKTLNVVNQTIPLVRQAGPMFNNMKSMLKIAKAFGSETTSRRQNNINTIKDVTTNSTKVINSLSDINYTGISETIKEKKESQNDNFPSFFV